MTRKVMESVLWPTLFGLIIFSVIREYRWWTLVILPAAYVVGWVLVKLLVEQPWRKEEP